MASISGQALLVGSNIPTAWQREPVWRVLDTGFCDGEAFFDTWQTWTADPQRPRLLHYVTITPAAPSCTALLRAMAAYPVLLADAADLQRQWFGLLPGFHRIVLRQGQVLLTLCIGPLQARLREQQFVADAIYLSALPQELQHAEWDRWGIKALARLCRRGTAIQVQAATTLLRGELMQAGFVFEESTPRAARAHLTDDAAGGLQGQYQPRWDVRTTRHAWRGVAPSPSTCVVVGAGLAGATVAASLARRGWQVKVLDTAAKPAAGASGLPVGLIAPQVSRDDSTRSRLSRAGVRATLALCRALLCHGEDWDSLGVLERRPGGGPVLPDSWPPEGRQWSHSGESERADASWAHGLVHGAVSIWHSNAGWIKPARLVQACLAQAGVQFIGQSDVRSVVRDSGLWFLLDANGTVLAQAPQMVVAGAGLSVQLLSTITWDEQQTVARIGRLAPMVAVRGQVSWAMQQRSDTDVFPPWPVNGHGSFIAHVPTQGSFAWFTGATYEHGASESPSPSIGHRENLARLSQLLPASANELALRFAQAQVNAWTGVRCTTIDRLPAAGPLDAGPPSLWVSTGMGSRGLTYAALCAELIAAQLGGEPLPVEASLAKSIAATRPQLLHHL